MKAVDHMGVVGSKWKMYVDPVMDVICYHNFHTNEKILEFKMKDEKLREINFENYHGEMRENLNKQIVKEKAEDWEFRLRTYMVRRMQYMYRVWKARKLRKDKMWRVHNKQYLVKKFHQNVLLEFIERYFSAAQSRQVR